MRLEPRSPRLARLRVAGGIAALIASLSVSPTASFLVSTLSIPSATSFRFQVPATSAARIALIRSHSTTHTSAQPTHPPQTRTSLLLRLLASSFAHKKARTFTKASESRIDYHNYSTVTHSAPKMTVQLFPGDGHGGEGLHWAPSNANACVIFMHGLGDTAEGWSEMVQLLEGAKLAEKTKLILPTAPIRPVTLNLGMRMNAWSDVRGLTHDANEDKEGLLASKARIDDIIEAEIKKGIAPNRIIVGGFSQGGAMAYLVGLTSPHRLGGIVALSSWCPLGKEIQVSEHYTVTVPHILHCHGDSDDLVKSVYGQTSVESVRNRLMDLGAAPDKAQEKIIFKQYAGLGHSANQQELNDVGAFLEKILGH